MLLLYYLIVPRRRLLVGVMLMLVHSEPSLPASVPFRKFDGGGAP